MKIIFPVAIISLLSLVIFNLPAKSQTIDRAQVKPVLFDGLIVGGYIDHGAYINCAGPAVKFTKKPFTILLGLLPGLKIKRDNTATGAPKNTLVTPSLGFGPTMIYKHLALQLPIYYNSKTSTKDGKWVPGIGMGYKF